VASQPHFLATRSASKPNSTRSFPVVFYPLRTQRSYVWNGKIPRSRSGSLHLKSLSSPPSSSFLFQSFAHLLSCHGSFQYFVHCYHCEDDPAFERGIIHQGSIMYASHINRLGEGLNVVKEVTRGASTPSAMMADWPDKSPGRQTMVGGCMTPLEMGQSSPAR
jgi:hypothetical protein